MALQKIIKITSLTLLSLIICFLSYKFCFFIAEKYFFDKFFYQKSMDHGYWANPKKIHFADFGTRAKDLISLASDQPNISHDNSFKIAVIGDSLVWGQGLKNNDRFVVLLTKKLNQIRPTTVYSLGGCGDNIFDDYMKYKKSIDVFGKMDLYIFGLYNNDLLLNEDDRYSTNKFVANKLDIGCSGKKITIPSNNSPITFSAETYADMEISSLATESANFCFYQHLVPLLPKNNGLFIDLGSLTDKWYGQSLFSNMISTSFNAISLLYNQSPKIKVSSHEKHPSVIGHQIYADTLFREITTNPKLGFTKQ